MVILKKRIYRNIDCVKSRFDENFEINWVILKYLKKVRDKHINTSSVSTQLSFFFNINKIKHQFIYNKLKIFLS